MWRWLIRVLVVLYLVLSMAACQMTMTAARSLGLETVDWVLGLAVFLICALQWDKSHEASRWIELPEMGKGLRLSRCHHRRRTHHHLGR